MYIKNKFLKALIGYCQDGGIDCNECKWKDTCKAYWLAVN